MLSIQQTPQATWHTQRPQATARMHHTGPGCGTARTSRHHHACHAARHASPHGAHAQHPARTMTTHTGIVHSSNRAHAAWRHGSRHSTHAALSARGAGHSSALRRYERLPKGRSGLHSCTSRLAQGALYNAEEPRGPHGPGACALGFRPLAHIKFYIANGNEKSKPSFLARPSAEHGVFPQSRNAVLEVETGSRA